MEITVGEIAKMLNAEVEGDPSLSIIGPTKIEEGQPGMLTFLANPKYEHYVYKTRASAVLVDKNFTPIKPIDTTLIRVENVYASVGQLLKWYEAQNKNGQTILDSSLNQSIHPSAQIAKDVVIGPHCVIGANVVISEGCEIQGQAFIGHDVVLGKRCKVLPGVRIKHDCIIGDDCVFYDNAVIGSDGFGYSNSEDGYEKIPQVGRVRIGNRVEIGAGSTIDRAVMGETIIEDGVIIDNLVHIGHNVIIGESTAIAAQSGVAGSTKVGKKCVIGGQVGISGHLTIADGTIIQAKSGISKSIVEENERVFGYPAIHYKDYLKSYAHFKRLPDIDDTVKQLLKRIEKLESEGLSSSDI